MTSRITSARAIWAARDPKAPADRALAGYSLLLVGLIVVAPVARLVWLFLTEPEVAGALGSPRVTDVAGLVLGALWGLALVVGASRGPAILPPFLVFAVADSDLPRLVVFRRRMVVAAVALGAAIGVIAATVAASTVARGHGTLVGVLSAGVAGALVGVVTSVLWLVGQVYPRGAKGVAVVIAGLGVSVALIGPGGLTSLTASAGLAALAVVAVASVAAVPALLERLEGDALAEQSQRWDTAIAHATSLDLSSASATFRARPTAGRRLCAILPSKRLGLVFAARDLVGAVRTPGRLASGTAFLAASAALLAVAIANPAYGLPLGAGSGALAFVGLGSMTDGIYHAARVASDLPVYGISDRRLLALQSAVPLGMSVVVSVASAAIASVVLGVGFSAVSLWAAPAVAVIALVTRISDALRGPSPLFLLTPAPSALGDPMPLIRVLWALDGTILASLAGAAGANADASAVGLCVAAFVVLAICSLRWSRRT